MSTQDLLREYVVFENEDWFPLEIEEFQGVTWFSCENQTVITDDVALLAIRGAAVEWLFKQGCLMGVYDDPEFFDVVQNGEELVSKRCIDQAIIAALKELGK